MFKMISKPFFLLCACRKAYKGIHNYEKLNYIEAANYWQQALELLPAGCDRLLGIFLNNAGRVLFLSGEHKKAQSFLEESLSIFERIHGKKHINTVAVLTNLSELYFEQGKYIQAKESYEQASIGFKMIQTEFSIKNILFNIFTNFINNDPKKLSKKLLYLRRKTKLGQEYVEQRVQLEESKKLAYLGVMASGVAHEINQPVGIIRAATSAALDDFKDKLFHVEEIEPLLNHIYQQTERLHAIIENFRQFARGDKSHREPVNINQVIQQTIGMFTQQFKQHHIHLVLQLDDNQPVPIADANYFSLQEVLVNFLTNAKDALEGRENATVWIKSFQEQEHVGFEVEDNGQGLSPDYRNHLFTPFVSTKPTEKGTGLGLHISHKIIQEFNGQLRYEDRTEGGARFIVTLPKFIG